MIRIILSGTLIIASLYSFAQPYDVINADKFRNAIEYKLDSLYEPTTDFGGATIGIILPDGRKYGFAVGMADIEKGIKMKPENRMLGGSSGKIFVSASIMQLVHKGDIQLDSEVKKFFRDHEWFDRIQNSQLLRIRNLLQHSSGISRYVFEEKFQNDIKNDPDRVWYPQQLLEYVFDKDPLFQPGSDFAYSDTNYIILGMIIEKVTGMTMYEYINQNILLPNNLNQISPQNKRTIEGLAAGYSSESDEFFPGKVAEDGVYKYNVQFEWAGGGYIMNTTELALAGKLIYEGKVFDKDLLKDYFSGIEASGLGGKWGLGVHIRETPFGLSYGHSGFFPGYVTSMLYFPEYKFSIATQVNTSDGQNLGLYRKLFQIIPAVIEILDENN